jgi:predicted ribosome quality control (RQC) complex YloA/Tae2 family protein
VNDDRAGWKSYDVDGYEVLVGKGARDNDRLTFRVAAPHDFWLHAAGYAGSHVVVRNPDRQAALPREVLDRAAQLAVHHSKARDAGGKVEVHVCRAADVSKPTGFAPGKVVVRRYQSVRVYSRNPFPD